MKTNLSASAAVMLRFLAGHPDPEPLGTIAQGLNASTRLVEEALAELTGRGFVETVIRGGGEHYQLTDAGHEATHVSRHAEGSADKYRLRLHLAAAVADYTGTEPTDEALDSLIKVTLKGYTPEPETVAYVVSDVEGRAPEDSTTVVGAHLEAYDLDHRHRAYEDVAEHPGNMLFLGWPRNATLQVYRLVRDS